MKAALEGIRVLELATVIAGPFAGSMLADFGAEVIKIEMPGTGDSFRKLGPLKEGKSIRWASMARGKKSITLDLHDEQAKEMFLQLVEKSDVIIENFRTGTMEKWGLGIDTLRGRNSKIIVIHVTGYGQTGPRKNFSGFGQPCTAFAGITYTMGYDDRPPISPSFSLADFVAGLNAVIGTVLSLYHRDASAGKAQEVDVSIYEGLFRMQEMVIADYHINGKIRERAPKILGAAGPSGTFQTKDGKWVVMVTPNDKLFEYLCNAMERRDLLENYAAVDQRFQAQPLLLGILEQWVGSMEFKKLEELCLKENYPVDLIYNIEDIFNDPHYKARNNIVEMPDEDFGTSKMPSVAPVLSETPGEIKWIGPKLGAHNDEIYKGLLGMSDSILRDLKEKNVI